MNKWLGKKNKCDLLIVRQVDIMQVRVEAQRLVDAPDFVLAQLQTLQ